MVKDTLAAGFNVVTEVGKKDPELTPSVPEMIRQIERDLAYGAASVTIESRQSAKGVGVFDKDGKVKGDDVEQIASAVDPSLLIWEAPTTEGQLFFISRFARTSTWQHRPDRHHPARGPPPRAARRHVPNGGVPAGGVRGLAGGGVVALGRVTLVDAGRRGGPRGIRVNRDPPGGLARGKLHRSFIERASSTGAVAIHFQNGEHWEPCASSSSTRWRCS